ncbi:MAG: glycosyltransferase family 2 protein [Bacteroidaceae bacterium]|nr:glycosyltransferase family 2 protein [Bacteroidaceae bacterium]
MKTAIVILNWNGVDMLRHYLPSVCAACPSDACVIVADNGSTDDSLRMLADEFPTVQTIALPQNYGFAEGYNQALRGLQAEYYLLLNSDVRVEPGFLQPLVDYMDTHPDCAACQPKLLSDAQPEQFEYAGACGGFIDRWGYPYCRGRVFQTIETDHGQYDTIVPILWASGAALFIRRTDWENVGGLDGRFFAHMEEIDLCWRLRARGRQIVCIPESRVYHLGGGTLQQGNPRKTFLNFRNNLLLLYKNLPDEQLHRTLRWRWLLDYVAALKFLLTGSAGEAKAVWKARRAFAKMRRSFTPQREENLRLSSVAHIPEIYPHSLLYTYYVQGRKTFAAMVKELQK